MHGGERKLSFVLAAGDRPMRLKITLILTVALFAVVSATASATPSARPAKDGARSSATPPGSSGGGVGGVDASGNAGDPTHTAATLPFTGIDLRFALVAGAALIVAGGAVRRRFRSGS
jgi:hypothetical protein